MGLFSKAERETYAEDCDHNAKAATYHANRADGIADDAEKQGMTSLASRERARATQLRIDAAIWHGNAYGARNP
jgi:hypothetical protein